MLVLKLGLYTIVPLTFSVTLAYVFYFLGSQTGVGGAVGAWVAGVGVGPLLAAILPFVAISALLIEVKEIAVAV